MHDWVVALQLLSLYWLAVILPPLPGVFCFSAIYNERVSTLSGLSSHLHQGKSVSYFEEEGNIIYEYRRQRVILSVCRSEIISVQVSKMLPLKSYGGKT